jgi:hypothetical protein
LARTAEARIYSDWSVSRTTAATDWCLGGMSLTSEFPFR